ncbi:ABC transporter permease [Algoriphagus halophytocola]|uniref:ABC transporter permease n=1 Tax=Algoriphagus halophytocola TaxID=2991499 RepID=A0ABY6MJK7_9BACT|nr:MULTISPECIES: ABC transporter permease [unclassified Algoriphagus]UZD23961.1 ABC transporter permease [Algoriphagus sp. TR-M5]WBL41333.1 ABC transporter permease [Algoriphagus sp. TR-M9]
MLKNYIKIAIRNLSKNKLHTGINLIGLSLGIGVSILIFFFVQFELNFDDFHHDSDRIFRLSRHQVEEGEDLRSYSTPIITAPTFENEFPQIEATTRYISSVAQAYLDESTTQSQRLMMVSPEFLNIFSFNLLEGDKDQALDDKFGIVITEEVAEKYFGDSHPIGKSIRLKMGDGFEAYTVTGLLENLPSNSSLDFEILMNDMNLDYTIGEENQNSWFNVFGDTYVKVTDPSAKASIEAGVEAMMKKVLGEEYEEGEYYFTLQPISEIHITDDPITGMAETTRPTLLWILAGIAFLILLIACINFTTMAIGRSTTRAKEVGVRKTMGAEFGQLVFQFLTEAFLTTLMALVFGLILAELLVPTFNNLFEKELSLVYGPLQILILVGLVLVITAMAGAYPAFFMSNLRPIKVLKGNLSMHFGKQALRKGLVAFQFFISFLLIASTLIMVNQMQAIRNYDLGFDQEMLVIVNVPEVNSTSFVKSIAAGFQQAELYRQALVGRSEVQSAGITISTYGDDAFWDAGFPTEEEEQFNFRVNFVGGDYIKTMGLELQEGRDFNPNPGADSSAFIINETFAQAIKWEDPLGEMMPNTRFKPHQIVGVVKDFHHNSLYKEIEPVLFAKSPETFFSGINMLMINSAANPKVIAKGTGNDFEAFRAVLENEWKKVFPLEAFTFSFMDQTVEEQYKADERLGKMVFLAAGIAILIAAMGLFAMAALSIAGRTKEIGIRKVLGASSASISWMFNKEFLFITVAGVLIALPLSLYLMQNWIAQFAVKDWPSWLNFALLALGGVAFTLLIVSAQAFKATRMNPVKTLKDE